MSSEWAKKTLKKRETRMRRNNERRLRDENDEIKWTSSRDERLNKENDIISAT